MAATVAERAVTARVWQGVSMAEALEVALVAALVRVRVALTMAGEMEVPPDMANAAEEVATQVSVQATAAGRPTHI